MYSMYLFKEEDYGKLAGIEHKYERSTLAQALVMIMEESKDCTAFVEKRCDERSNVDEEASIRCLGTHRRPATLKNASLFM